jgi:hypothetical protein
LRSPGDSTFPATAAISMNSGTQRQTGNAEIAEGWSLTDMSVWEAASCVSFRLNEVHRRST